MRLIHPLEHFCVMGFPLFLSDYDGGGGHFSCLPWPEEFLMGMAAGIAGQLCGNGMHCASLGAWIQFILSVLRQIDQTPAPTVDPRMKERNHSPPPLQPPLLRLPYLLGTCVYPRTCVFASVGDCACVRACVVFAWLCACFCVGVCVCVCGCGCVSASSVPCFPSVHSHLGIKESGAAAAASHFATTQHVSPWPRRCGGRGLPDGRRQSS